MNETIKEVPLDELHPFASLSALASAIAAFNFAIARCLF